MSLLSRILDPNNLRPFFDVASITADMIKAVREDSDFLALARKALFPLPTDRELALDPDPFPPFEASDAPRFQGKKIAVVASGGSGATAALVGVHRAFEEAGLQPVAISASSGSVLFGLLWACGLDSAEVARFWLTLRRKDYLDPDWLALARSTGRALGGWAGLVRGEALERAVRRLVGDRRLGETRIPFSTVAWSIDVNRIEVLSTTSTPDLPVALAVRVAISIPIFVEPVPIGGHLYGDGGVVDIFPLRPVLEHRPEVVVGLNAYLPEGFAGEDVTGWHQRSFAILRASGQLRWSGMVELAREQARLAGDRLVLLHPVPYAEVRGGRFYETFVDRSRWPDFMRAGRRTMRDVLGSRPRRSPVPTPAEESRASPTHRADGTGHMAL